MKVDPHLLKLLIFYPIKHTFKYFLDFKSANKIYLGILLYIIIIIINFYKIRRSFYFLDWIWYVGSINFWLVYMLVDSTLNDYIFICHILLKKFNFNKYKIQQLQEMKILIVMKAPFFLTYKINILNWIKWYLFKNIKNK